MSNLYIKRVEIENYKTHSNTIVDFSLVDSIVGSNGAGKTNLIKAALLVLNHQNFPAHHIKRGKTKARIKVTLGNGYSIERVRTATSQQTKIYEPSGNVTTLEGKKDITDKINSICKLNDIELKDKEKINLNFVNARNKTSIMEGAPSSLAKRFSYILGIEQIERVKTNTLKETKSLQNDLLSMEKDVKLLQDVLSQSKNKYSTIDSLLCLIEKGNRDFERINNELNKCRKVFNHWDILNFNVDSFEDLSTQLDTLNKLKNIDFDIFDVCENNKVPEFNNFDLLEKLKDLVSSFDPIETSHISEVECKLEGLKKDLDICSSCGMVVSDE